jgi:hypothetical protein
VGGVRAIVTSILILGNGVYHGLLMRLILLLRIVFALFRRGIAVAAVPLLPHPRSVVLVPYVFRRAADRVVAGAVARQAY